MRFFRIATLAPWAPLLGAYMLFAALLLVRRPDAILRPQLWAEEAGRFFPQAFHSPAISNLGQIAFGYFDLLLWTVSEFATLFPLTEVPTVFTAIAVLIQAAVPLFLVSGRSRSWLGPLPYRVFAALLYCLMPNSFEAHAIMLHVRIHLAVLALLILMSEPPGTAAGRILDRLLLLLCSLSGPFVFFLAIAAGWVLLRHRRTKEVWVNFFIVVVGVGAAIFALAVSLDQRHAGEMGASWERLLRIVGGNLVLGLLVGGKTYEKLSAQPWLNAAAAAGAFLLLVIVLLVVGKGNDVQRGLLLLGFGSLALALASPLAAFDRPHWEALWMYRPGYGQRYFVPATAALILATIPLLHQLRLPLRIFPLLLLTATTFVAVPVDFRLPPFVDFNYRAQAARFDELPPGGVLAIPANPPGWTLELRKPTDL